MDNIQTSRLNGFDLYSDGCPTHSAAARRSFEATPEICALDITQRATYGRTDERRTDTSIAADNAEESFVRAFVREERDHADFLRIFGSFAAAAALNSEISPFEGDNRGQTVFGPVVPRNAGGRARTKRATNHRRKREGGRKKEGGGGE